MAYLGRQPNTGVRSRYIYTATASQTTFSGTDDDGKTLKYEDAAYLDVFLNGVLLKPVTDYTATTKTSVVLTSAAAASDIVEIVAYDIANIADTVSKANGGTFDADVSVNGTVTSTGSTVNGTVTSDALNVSAASPNIDVTDTGTSHASQDFLTNSSTVRATIGVESSTGGGLFVGSSPYAAVFGTASAGNAQFATNNNVRMTLDSSGNVGIGTASPTGSGKILHVDSSTTVADLHMTNSFSGATASDGFVLRYSGASAEFLNREVGSLIFYTSGTSRMTIDDAGRFFVPNVYASTTSGGANVNVASSGRLERSTSSLRYKNTINDATHGLTELLTLRPVTFKGNNDGDTVFGGLIAEEVHDAGLTEFVQYDEEDRPDALAYGNMVSLCIKAIQELNTKVETLEAENVAIKARLDALENA
jgi:hypothetical protein